MEIAARYVKEKYGQHSQCHMAYRPWDQWRLRHRLADVLQKRALTCTSEPGLTGVGVVTFIGANRVCRRRVRQNCGSKADHINCGTSSFWSVNFGLWWQFSHNCGTQAGRKQGQSSKRKLLSMGSCHASRKLHSSNLHVTKSLH